MAEATRQMRIGFAGTPGFAAEIFGALLDAGYRPEVVYCQPDRPVGRGKRLQPGPVKSLAQEHRIELRQPPRLRGAEEIAALQQLDLDVLIVAAYGLLLPQSVLEVPAYGCINVHASLLPRWRGAAPVERAIMAGDRETGVCLMQMDAGLDTGPVLARQTCPIEDRIEGPALEARLAQLGATTLIGCLPRLATLVPEPQSATGVTYADKLTRADCAIHWEQCATVLDRQIRALTGRMPAVAMQQELRIRILEARPAPAISGAAPGSIIDTSDGIRVACGSGSLILRRIQLSRGKGTVLDAAEALRGFPAVFAIGARLDDGPG